MKRVHFIGIGGIGLSALALFLHERGYEISGSDSMPSKITKGLANRGMKIYKGHSKEHIKGADLVIYSAAIRKDNEEYLAALKADFPCLSRKDALPLILQGKNVIAIAGAHGKSTTSSILASLLDSSMIIGAVSKQYGSNMIYKKSEFLVFEADESDSSFLNANPHTAVVTNVDAEHLEHYGGNYCLLKNAYKEFLLKAKQRVINFEDEYLSTLKIDALRLNPSKDITNISYKIKDFLPYLSFDLAKHGRFELFGLGEHNAINASLALLVALQYENADVLRKRLLAYEGIKKRFDILYATQQMALIDDYAHHPKEIKACLNSAQIYAKLAGYDKISVLFEPHKFSRFLALKQDFVEVLSKVENLYILPVYAASEDAVRIDFAKIFPKATLVEKIQRNERSLLINDDILLKRGLVVGMGAGDITYKLRGKYD